MRRFLLLLTLGVIFTWAMVACRPAPATEEVLPTSPAAPSPEAPKTEEPPVEYTNLPAPLMGAEIKRIGSLPSIQLLGEAGASLLRHNSLVWSDVEPVEGEYQWQATAKLEEGLVNASNQGLNVILIVQSTPPWAQLREGYFCGPIKQEKLSAFANFLTAAVERYSAPPYNIKYWELGNEPDIDPGFVAGDAAFGCWGDEKDEYYGGGYYAEMLKVAYPAIKAVDPNAQVLIGGLLLDCDPTNPPEDKPCLPARFLEGIILNGGGDSFDIVSFHGYPYFSTDTPAGGLYYDLHFPSWEARGGVVLGKADYLREVMSQFGIDKPLMHTEGSLICPDWNKTDCNPPTEAFYQAQADYVVWLYVRNWAENIQGTVWYQFEGPGWRHSGMLTKDEQTRPSYQAFQFLNKELGEATYVAKVHDYPDLAGYEFISGTKVIWVLWSTDGQAHPAALPENTSAVLDKFGAPVPFEGGEISVLSPVYVEFTP